MSVGLALTRTILVRHRIGISVVGAYMAIACTALLIFKQDRMPPTIAAILFLGLMVASFYLITVFTHSDSDVATPGSTYPNYYFTLPVKTTDLVIWPVATGALCIGGTTLLFGMAYSRAGFDVNPLDGVLIAVTLLTLLQAIFWYPFGVAYLKLVFTIAAGAGVTVLSFGHAIFGIPEWSRIALFMLVILLSVAAIVRGVSRARAGDIYVKGRIEQEKALPVSKDVPKLKPFGSPGQSQFWYEWRQQGKTLTILSGILFLLFMVPCIWNDTLSPIYDLRKANSPIVPTAPTFLLAYFPLVVFLMVVYSWAIGCGAKRTDLKRGERTFHLFFGTRPMSDEGLVWSKIKVSAVSVGLSWLGLFLLSSPLLLMKGGYATRDYVYPIHAPLYRVLAEYITPHMLGVAFCFLGLMIFFCWRNYIVGFWAELSGSLFLRYAQPLVSCASIVCIAVWFQTAGTAAALEFLPFALGFAVAVKFAIATYLIARQRREKILASSSAMKIVAGYVLGVVVLGAAFIYVAQPWYQAMAEIDVLNRIKNVTTVLLILFYVPLVRILLPISALSYNRHR